MVGRFNYNYMSLCIYAESRLAVQKKLITFITGWPVNSSRLR